MQDVNFYKANEAFGEFSNFAAFPIQLDDLVWPTSEHYFQSQKFEDNSYREKIRQFKSPMIAARMGRSHKQKLRSDWELVKIEIMRTALMAKFSQHEKLKVLLLSTDNAKLVEHTVNDAYWGDGGDGKGQNMLGVLLMELRDKMRSEQL